MSTDKIPISLTRPEWSLVEDFLCAGIASLHALSSQALPGVDVIELIDQKAQDIHGIIGAIKRETGPTMETLTQ